MAEKEQEPIIVDTLFLGVARPRTLLGAPYLLTVFAGMFSAIVFLIIKNPLTLITGAPIILIGRLLVKYDPYRMQSLEQFSRLRAKLLRSSRFWSTEGRRIVAISPLQSAWKRRENER